MGVPHFFIHFMVGFFTIHNLGYPHTMENPTKTSQLWLKDMATLADPKKPSGYDEHSHGIDGP